MEEAGTGKEALSAVQQRPFDLVLLDINMPGLSGVEVCRQIRAHCAAHGNCHGDGARCGRRQDSRAGRRRRRLRYQAVSFSGAGCAHGGGAAKVTGGERARSGTVLQAGDLKIDLEHRLVWKNDAEIRLSPKEFDLLSYLWKTRALL